MDPPAYASAQECIHPGQDHFGPEEFFLNGPPAPDEDDPDAFRMCDGEGWAVTAPFTPVVPVTSIGALLELTGGVTLGGSLAMAKACVIYYGACEHPNGGVAVGGSLSLWGSAGDDLAGGVVVGGALSLTSSGSSLFGGVAVGGALRMGGSGLMTLAGGVEVGGSAISLSTSGMSLEGGVVVGGFFPTSSVSGITLAGGVTVGGALVGSGEGTCGAVPLLVGARRRPHILSQDEIAFPAGTHTGDLILLFVFEAVSPQIVTLPLTWTALGASAPFGWPVSVGCYYRIWDGVGSAGVLVHGAIGHQLQLACVAIRGGGAPILAGTDADTTSVQQLPTYTVMDCPGTLIAAAGCDDYDNNYNTFTGVDTLIPSPEQTPMSLWKLRPAGPGSVGGGFVLPDNPADWVSLLVFIPPAP